MTPEEAIKNLEEADVIRFIDWYNEDNNSGRIRMTIGIGYDFEHDLAPLAREFKQKCIDFYKNQLQQPKIKFFKPK